MKAKWTLALAAFLLVGGAACTKQDNKTAEEANVESEFYANQPLESGQYQAVNYLITKKDGKERKGKFDGRILIALDPENSGIYVYENGNRTKIDYLLALDGGFQPGDSSIYKATDKKEREVEIRPDSTLYSLSFSTANETVKIGFEKKPIMTAAPVEILEKIKKEKDKNK